MQTRIVNNQIKAHGREVVGEVRKAHRETAEFIAAEQRERVPVLTGALKASISVEDINEDVVAILEGGEPVNYPIYVEFGTENQPAQQHIRPAFKSGMRFLRQRLASIKK